MASWLSNNFCIQRDFIHKILYLNNLIYLFALKVALNSVTNDLSSAQLGGVVVAVQPNPRLGETNSCIFYEVGEIEF